jgi:acetyl-CoA carboxylase carboxyltransferase component
MGGPQAASVLLQVRVDNLRRQNVTLSPEDRERFKEPIIETYDHEGSPYFSTARLWDDGIIDPVDTRTALGIGLDAAARSPVPDTKFGVFRM